MAAKGSVTGYSEVSVSCLNHSSAKSNSFLVDNSTDFLHILSQVGDIVPSLKYETVDVFRRIRRGIVVKHAMLPG